MASPAKRMAVRASVGECGSPTVDGRDGLHPHRGFPGQGESLQDRESATVAGMVGAAKRQRQQRQQRRVGDRPRSGRVRCGAQPGEPGADGGGGLPALAVAAAYLGPACGHVHSLQGRPRPFGVVLDLQRLAVPPLLPAVPVRGCGEAFASRYRRLQCAAAYCGLARVLAAAARGATTSRGADGSRAHCGQPARRCAVPGTGQDVEEGSRGGSQKVWKEKEGRRVTRGGMGIVLDQRSRA